MTPYLDFKVTVFEHQITQKWCKIVTVIVIVTTADQYKVVYDLLIGATFSYLNDP